MEIDIKQVQGCLFVSLPKNIRRENIKQVQQRIESTMDETVLNLVFNLSQLANVTSLTISLLIYFKKQLTATGNDIYLVRVPDNCKQLLKSLKIDTVIDIYEDEQELLNSLD